MKDIKELRSLNISELNTELLNLREEQLKLRMKRANGSLNKLDLIKETRKTIARVKTIMSEKAGKRHVE